MHDPLTPHSHDNNTRPPDESLHLVLTRPNGTRQIVTAEALRRYPTATIPRYTYMTDHGRHGPYCLRGVALLTLVQAEVAQPWSQVEVVSADGFGNRIWAEELHTPHTADPILLCYETDSRALTRAEGAIRLVVPSETDNALRQIKWVREVRVLPR